MASSTPRVIPEFTGLQVNTAVQSLAIPILYGTPRVSINVIYYNGFNSQLVSQNGGGKGILGGGKGGADAVEYFVTFIAAVGEGPIGDPLIIYQDQNVWTPATFPTNGASWFNGLSTQAAWSYVAATWPADSRGYKNTAYYGFANAQIDASATIPQLNLVVPGFLAGSSPLNNSVITISTGQYDPNGNPVSYIGNIALGFADADPAAVIFDYLTSAVYGATFPSNFVDAASLSTTANGFNSGVGDSGLSTYCQAVGLAWSLVLNNAESAGSVLDRLCKNLAAAIVWNGALLRFVPYWDQFSGTNPGWDVAGGIPLKYYSPPITPIVTITLDQILDDESEDADPITFSRKDPQEVYNTVRLSFRDRTNFFNDNPVSDQDEAHIELYGPRTDNIGSAGEFSLAAYAMTSATMQLRRNISVMNTYQWKMSPFWAWLEPMFVVNIPDPTNWANLIAVRITEVEDDEDENCLITAEQFPLGAQSPAITPAAPSTPPNQGATNIPPSPVYPPVMFFPTTTMLAAMGFMVPQFVLGTSGGNTAAYPGILDPGWGGANVWVSLDQVNYEIIGTLNGPSTLGSLTLPVPGYSGVNPDNVHTITVNLSECDGNLGSVSADAAAAGSSLCIMQDLSGFEAFSYTTATLVAPGTYALTGLYRGLFGTLSRSFGTGSQFLFVGSSANIFKKPLPTGYIGSNFWTKLQSFNNFNSAIEDLGECVAYPMVAYGPTPPAPVLPPMMRATTRKLPNKGQPLGQTLPKVRRRKPSP